MSVLNVNRIVDASGGVLAPISSVMRNRIINGAMVIDQRNAGASVSGTSGVFSVDRWKVQNNSGSARFNIQQNAGSVTPPAGFSNYLGVTSTGSYTVSSTDVISVVQAIEGFNTADLAWGTANASTVTMSFWVRSSLTGTFGGALKNANASYSYPFTYTISATNTWEQKSITIVGAPASTWASNNSASIEIYFSMGTGATFNGTAGAWAASDFRSATGSTSVVGTNGATFYITGVQLEKGTQATGFEYRQYGTELALCQRYYYLLASGINRTLGSGFYATSTRVDCNITFKTSMRAAPTFEQSSGTNFYAIYAGGISDLFNSFVGGSEIGTEGLSIYANSNVSGTTGQAGSVYTNNASSYIAFSAEL